MRDARIVLSLLFALATVPAPAGEEGKAPDKPWSKSDGGFAATLELTPQGEAIFASVLFSGCATNEKGNCDVMARFTTKTPEGKSLGNPIEADLGATNMPGQALIRMTTGKLGVVIQPGDAPGAYQVRVEVLDRISKKQMVLERELKADPSLAR